MMSMNANSLSVSQALYGEDGVSGTGFVRRHPDSGSAKYIEKVSHLIFPNTRLCEQETSANQESRSW
jgi:hypothetical protein